jgi:tripartite-type tricarboxylate transporter receptor subunit TctC
MDPDGRRPGGAFDWSRPGGCPILAAEAIMLIVPFAAGGGTDAFARPLAVQLDQQLGTRVLIENRAGGGGTIGAAAAAKAPPDGYTFFVGAAHHAIAPAVYPKLSYSIETDFIPIAMIARPPHVVVVHPRQGRRHDAG